MNQLFWYEHQGKTFSNQWVVKQYEQDHNTFVPFVADYEQYRKALLDKTIDLQHNYDLDYLQLLRKTKSYIRLFYSGGSDSHHILSTAVQNKIFIDEVVVITRNLYNRESLQSCDQEVIDLAIPYLNTLDPTQVGKIVFENFDADYLRDFYQQPDWMFNGSSGEIGFRLHQLKGYESDQPNQADCQIIGSEKPSLICYKDRWYATSIDSELNTKACLQEPCLFYMMPENIKSYLARALKYKDQILQSGMQVNHSYHFFPISLNYNYSVQIGKCQGANFFNQKERSALAEVILQEDFDLLGKWHRSLDYLYSVFPDIKVGHTYQRTTAGKFLWFIDLETFEIFSQTDLIPNGFEHC